MNTAGLVSYITAYLTLPLRFAGYEWNRSSPLRSSPDTASPMYPDRPIRPLPKRRLRDRMSPEQAEHMVYPAHPPTAGPLFSFPYSTGDRGGRVVRQGESDHHACHCGHNHSEVESEEEEDERGAPVPSSPSYHYSNGRSAPGRQAVHHAHAHAYAKPGSTASSVDGYESFENTNNKKKRKIPNMGNANTHHSSLSTEMASMGISHPPDGAALDDVEGPGRYYGSAPATPQPHQHHQQQQQQQQQQQAPPPPPNSTSSAGTGIAGAGRGRFGRSASGRSERRVLGNSTNLVNAKASTKRPPDQAGIISTAIANAQATPPHAGNENVSLLQQEAAKHPANKTQFTFTCGSDSASKMAWPGQENGMPGAFPPSLPHARARPPVRPDNLANQGTQTSPHMNGNHPTAVKNAPAQRGPPPSQQAPPPPKPRRSPSKMYAIAARKRRQNQEYVNAQNPPNPAWICEFCEYEDIFGHPPAALIRMYEKKDLAERRRLAEKRRLLAKARMKGRKGKKQNKKQNNANNQQTQNAPPGGYEKRPEDDAPDGQDDFYDDEYDSVPPQQPPPPRCCDHPGCHSHQHHRAPMAQVEHRASTTNGA
ncbi:hypothetical protein P280DRAFT_4606 [Massarina eburnea CBS 473.64]|uniref:Uncharacterized protein n=1 Tax=Massarina eburnea CBS 473.64 TaxID=1395130 RepID=A0A6A6SE77_9PLEO|nr:hypothetical protein P280DRAFT_4606 [Massarina eburnea CBS 473.64]